MRSLGRLPMSTTVLSPCPEGWGRRSRRLHSSPQDATLHDHELARTLRALGEPASALMPLYAGSFRSLAEVEYVTARWVDWYNNRCLHGSHGIFAPIEFERLH